MLAKMNRLHKMREFQNVFKNSKPFFSDYLSVRASLRKSGEAGTETRFGVVVSNKFDKRATRRNSMKRQIRQVLRETIPFLRPGYDVVVFAKGQVSFPYSQESVREHLREVLAKAGVMEAKK